MSQWNLLMKVKGQKLGKKAKVYKKLKILTNGQNESYYNRMILSNLFVNIKCSKHVEKAKVTNRRKNALHC